MASIVSCCPYLSKILFLISQSIFSYGKFDDWSWCFFPQRHYVQGLSLVWNKKLFFLETHISRFDMLITAIFAICLISCTLSNNGSLRSNYILCRVTLIISLNISELGHHCTLLWKTTIIGILSLLNSFIILSLLLEVEFVLRHSDFKIFIIIDIHSLLIWSCSLFSTEKACTAFFIFVLLIIIAVWETFLTWKEWTSK